MRLFNELCLGTNHVEKAVLVADEQTRYGLKLSEMDVPFISFMLNGKDTLGILKHITDEYADTVLMDGTDYRKPLKQIQVLHLGYMSFESGNCVQYKNKLYVYARETMYSSNPERCRLPVDILAWAEKYDKNINDYINEFELLKLTKHTFTETAIPVELFAGKDPNCWMREDRFGELPTLNYFSMFKCRYSQLYFRGTERVQTTHRVYTHVARSVLEAGIKLTCTQCGAEHIARTDVEMNQSELCPECYAKVPRCVVCGRQAYKTLDGLSVCSSHSSKHDVGGYHSNSSRSGPKFIGQHESENFPLFLGVELEVDYLASGITSCYPGLALVHMRKNLAHEYVEYCRDGSLSDSYGIEMISQPKSILAWRESMPIWAKTFKSIIKAGMRGHDAEHAGLHVHVSREAFKEPAKAFTRLQVLLHRHFNKLLLVSRRVESFMQSYARPIRELINIDHATTAHMDVLSKCMELGFAGHSMLAQDDDLPTFEFRMFRSTLNPESFEATLEFVYGICKFVNEHDFNACNTISWDDLIATINRPVLTAYVERIVRTAKDKKECSEIGVESEIEDVQVVVVEPLISTVAVSTIDPNTIVTASVPF